MSGFTEHITLSDDEQAIVIFRSSPVVIWVHLALPIIALFALFLFLFPLITLGTNGVIFFCSALVIDVLWMLRKVMVWYGTITVLTTRRLLCIKRQGFFKKETQEILLDNISELTCHFRGLIQTLFRYGDVRLTLYTASSGSVLRDLIQPQVMLNCISQQIALVKQGKVSAVELPTSEENIKRGRMVPKKEVSHIPKRI